MMTGDAWQDADTFHPWAFFDPDAERILSMDWSGWLAAIGSTYNSHVFLTSPELQAAPLAVVDGVVMFKVKRAMGATLKPGKDFFVTCRLSAANTEVQDKTLYLRIQEF